MKAGEIAEFLGAEIVGDAEVEVISVASLEAAQEGDLAFFERGDMSQTGASCLIVPAASTGIAGTAVIRSSEPKLDFARTAALLHPPKKRDPKIHPSAIISPDARIGADVFIG